MQVETYKEGWTISIIIHHRCPSSSIVLVFLRPLTRSSMENRRLPSSYSTSAILSGRSDDILENNQEEKNNEDYIEWSIFRMHLHTIPLFLIPFVLLFSLFSLSPLLDTFDDGGDGEQTLEKGGSKSNYVHIRIQQRNGRKSLTTVQGLAIDLDLKKILKALKKVRIEYPLDLEVSMIFMCLRYVSFSLFFLDLFY